MSAVNVAWEQLVRRSLAGIDPARGTAPLSPGAPVVMLTDRLIENALERRASDIHLEPTGRELVVRYRIDGILEPGCPPLPGELAGIIVNRLKVMSRLNVAEHRLPQDGRFSFEFGARPVDVRVSVMPLLTGEKVVLRLLNVVGRLLTPEQLGMSPDNEATFRRWCRQPYGMVLATGPVGSGKTTTLYAGLGLMDKQQKNIVSIEDPVEYAINGVNQIQVEPDTLTFARSLRSVLRQDPDIIMVGEIRDEETAEIAVRAALTGRLILSTLHTGTAAGAVARLFDMGVKPYLLGTALIGIMAQRLVRRLCPYCREKYQLVVDDPEREILGTDYDGDGIFYRPHAGGCEHCGGRGYFDRAAIHEMLPVTGEIQRAVLARAHGNELEKLARAVGLRSLKADGLAKAAAGITDLQEVGRIIYGG